jgi:hypothetical protein
MENNTETDRIVALEAKIDALTKMIQKIDRTVNPPWWKKILLFIYHNFFTIVLLVALGYIAWKAWGIYLDVMTQVTEVKLQIEELKQIPANMQDSLQIVIENTLQKIKFW